MASLSSDVGRLRTFGEKAWGKTKIFVLEAILRPARPMGMIRLGSYYGGWWIPRADPTQGAAFCVGAGTDVSFDLELLRLGYRVYTVDPTPESVAYVAEHAPELTLLPLGLWHEAGEIEFARDEVWSESWAIGTGPSGRTDVLMLPVRTVRGLMETTGERDVAILKIDIEGAEHMVIQSMLADGIRPQCVCVEFDDHRFARVIRSTRRLQAAGYNLLQIEGRNYIFALE
jgi:FkbM family methyltransferase